MTIDHVIDYSPRDEFLTYHNRRQRWSVIVAHRRAGKTVAAINDIILRALTNRRLDSRYGYVAPFISQAKMIAWGYLNKFCAGLIAKKNESELSIKLKNGALIRLFGSDNPDSLRGGYFDGVVLDEPADMKPNVWGEIIRPMLADRGGWATFIGTPKGRDQFWRIFEHAKSSKNWFVSYLPVSATKIISQRELDDLRATQSENQFQQEFECSFDAEVAGMILQRYINDARNENRIHENVRLDAKGDGIFVSCDLGFRDTAAFWYWQPVPGGYNLLLYDSDNGLDVSDWIPRIERNLNDIGGNLSKIYLPHDARAKTFQSAHTVEDRFCQFFGAGKIHIVPMTSKLDRIEAARTVIKKCAFNSIHCEHGIDALNAWKFSYIAERDIYSKEPVHDWASHGSDAFSYGAQMIQEKVAQKTVSYEQKQLTLDDFWRKNERSI